MSELFTLTERIENCEDDYYDNHVTEELLGVYSTFEIAYNEYMKVSKDKNRTFVYFIEEWEINGPRKNAHRYYQY